MPLLILMTANHIAMILFPFPIFSLLPVLLSRLLLLLLLLPLLLLLLLLLLLQRHQLEMDVFINSLS